ncbi:MAG: hypothetical protein B6D44_01195 [Ignavibacteriales bacterium UTCHB2]|jgi:FkbM family methyltransferase|nr:MAG: hypothetical protein B6D44_01195 [Ignavibacteriales bacterium UTCHB2]
MRELLRKLKRMIFHIRRGVLLRYFFLAVFPGYKIIKKSNDSILVKTRFDKITYNLPTVHDEYLFVANPKSELLLSTYINIESGTFIDVGAFIGRYSIRLARKDNLRVISVEPNPSSLKLLKENIRLNNVEKKIEIVSAALVADESETDILMELNHGRSKITEHKLQSADTFAQVKAISFNKLRAQYKINTEDELLIKIDIEGYEDKLLRSMKEFLLNTTNKFKLVCEILHNSPKKNETIEYVKSLGFNILQVDSENFYFYKNLE